VNIGQNETYMITSVDTTLQSPRWMRRNVSPDRHHESHQCRNGVME